MTKKRAHIIIPLFIIPLLAFVLTHCTSQNEADKFIGKWQNASSPKQVCVIKRDGDKYSLQYMLGQRVDCTYSGSYDKAKKVMLFENIERKGMYREFKIGKNENELLHRFKPSPNADYSDEERYIKVN